MRGIYLTGTDTEVGKTIVTRAIVRALVRRGIDVVALKPVESGAPEVDGEECVAWRWSTPQGALDEHREGRLMLVFPTIKTLEQLAAFPHADALLEHARGKEVRPVEPRVLVSGETARIVLPGEPGYE